MNIIKSFNKTIDYLETVLDDEIDEKKVTAMMTSIARGKACSYDAISDKFFSLNCKTNYCHECKMKIKLATEIIENHNFWNSGRGSHHLTGRLIPLNKKAPAVP